MRDFLRGWRRKTGIVTLVMACAFTGLWLRSPDVHDSVRIQALGTEIILSSFKGDHFWTLGIHAKMESVGGGIVEYRSEPAADGVSNLFSSANSSRREKQIRNPVVGHYHIKTNQLALIIPLTVLSAYLLIVRPRQTVLKQTAEPTPTTGT